MKGRYGFDYVHHKQRLTKPLIRKPGVPEARGLHDGPGEPARVFPRGELGGGARSRRGQAESDSRQPRRRSALAGFGSAKGTNEEAYLFQKLVRTGFGTNNVDHCTRLCHASSVAALMEGIGSGAVSNQVNDVARAEVIFLIGANPIVEPPGGRDLDQERREEGRQADLRRSAPLGAVAPRAHHAAVQARHRRRAAQRDDAHHRRTRASSTRTSSRAARSATRSSRRTSRATAPKRWRRSAASPPRRSRRSRACSRRRKAR